MDLRTTCAGGEGGRVSAMQCVDSDHRGIFCCRWYSPSATVVDYFSLSLPLSLLLSVRTYLDLS